MVLGVQIVNKEANPAGEEHNCAADDFSNQGDGLLDNVKNSGNCQYKTYNVNDSTHNMNVLNSFQTQI